MKIKYALIIVVVMLALTPLFAENSIWRIIFEISCFVLYFLLAIFALRQHKRNDFIAYVFLILISAIGIFDKGGDYFYIQIILLVIMLILITIEQRKTNGID